MLNASSPFAPHASTLPSVSFEFFPPKTAAGEDKLDEAARQLCFFEPQFVSVTCGAGGSAVDGTTATVNRIRRQAGIEIVPHVAIARQRRSRLREALSEYKKTGVRRIVAVRGDASQTADEEFDGDTYPNTIDFVAELRHDFGLDPIVAAYPDVHPRAQSPAQDLDHLKRKVEAGAALAISQFFFLPETFLRFRDKLRATGIKIPLAAGIMPIHNLAQVVKFANGCGTLVPDGFTQRFERHGGDEKALFDEGLTHAIELCNRLRREGIDHFHFYTLNRSEMTGTICKEMGFGIQDSGIETIPPNPEPQIPFR